MADYPDLDETTPVYAARENEWFSEHKESLAKVQVQIEQQRVRLRWIVAFATLVVIVALGILECFLLRKVLGLGITAADTLLVVLVISPIVAVTTLIVFLLHGVFRAYQQTTRKNQIPGEAVAKGAAEAFMGQ